jgi:hypothetical protein
MRWTLKSEEMAINFREIKARLIATPNEGTLKGSHFTRKKQPVLDLGHTRLITLTPSWACG